MLDTVIRLINAFVYNTGDWLRWKIEAVRKQPGFWNDELESFAKIVPEGADVLEIGPGTGIEAVTLLGHLKNAKYRAIEPSRLHAKETTERLQEEGYIPTVYTKGVEEIDNINHLKYKKFDAILALASLLHLRKASLPKVLRNVRYKMKNDAVAMVVMIKGEGEGFSKKRRMWFSYYQPEEIESMFSDARFRIVHRGEREIPNKTYLVYYLKAC